MEKIMGKIIEELTKMTIPELEEIRSTWIPGLKNKKLSDCVIKLCEETLGVIIEQKREREGTEA